MCNFLKSLCIHTTYLSFLFMNFKLNILFMVLILHWNVEITINHMDWSFSCASFCLICLLRMQISMEIWDFLDWGLNLTEFCEIFNDLGTRFWVVLKDFQSIEGSTCTDFGLIVVFVPGFIPSKFWFQILIFYSVFWDFILVSECSQPFPAICTIMAVSSSKSSPFRVYTMQKTSLTIIGHCNNSFLFSHHRIYAKFSV